MRWLRDFLFGAPVGPLWRYCVLAGPVALLPSAALVASVLLVLTLFEVDIASVSRPHRELTMGYAFGTVVIAPLIETLLLAGGIRVLSIFTTKPLLIAATSAFIWGGFHAVFGAIGFFGTVWSFFVFSCGYLAWRKTSFRHGFVAASVPHAFQNAAAILFVYFGTRA